ncbi:hypothetical protein ACELLULO517_08890 [Acidisoma cellulosilytica]|uniref:PepSY domain-containing protein n=1 Tax=Acidisoma cellulosilyticum TaxID=2802395 RepID=A0A963Z1M3_9PROT|nr:hypothetical protein [Acidisoma cellulosilyticum]MCB8880347.1 hypothetical protein [Acidisoma cellulosilyticum]
MGRIATAAIITIALAGATVQSFAGGLPSDDKAGVTAQASLPVDALLADAAPSAPPMPSMMPGADQPMPPPPGGFPPGGPGDRMRPPGPMMGWGPHPGMHGPWDRMRHMAQTWGLFFNQKDKNLSDSDVQTLAAAVLLIHGNHSWKVANVADAADGSVTFAYTTTDGAVIARFSMDRHTGRLTRIG